MKKLLLFALLACCAAFPLAAGPLKIGWASAPIHDGRTHTQIYGQSHLRWDRDGVLDPLTATCLVIDDGKDQLIFLSVDTSNFGYGNTPGPHIMKLLTKIAPDLPQEKIISGATHTHTGGDMENRPIQKYLQDKVGKENTFTPYAIDAIANIIKQAWENRKPGRVAYGFSYAVVGHQRRAVYFNDRSKLPGTQPAKMLVDGNAVMYGNPNKPDFSHHETGADPAVNFLFTFDDKDKLTGAIVNIPCPSQCSESEWFLSADYWANVRENLRSRYGKDLYILPQCAAAGDLSPHLRSYRRASKRKWLLKYGRAEKYRDEFNRCDIAERVGIAFDDAYSWAQKEKFADLPIQNRRIELKLPRIIPSDADIEAAERVLKVVEGADKIDVGKITDEKARKRADVNQTMLRRAKEVIRRRETLTSKDTITTFINVARLGNIAFFSNPFELYMDYMHRLQARSPFEQTFVIQLGMPGKGTYLGTERAQANRGYGVGATTKVSTEGGQLMIEKVLETLKEMHDGTLPPEAKK